MPRSIRHGLRDGDLASSGAVDSLQAELPSNAKLETYPSPRPGSMACQNHTHSGPQSTLSGMMYVRLVKQKTVPLKSANASKDGEIRKLFGCFSFGLAQEGEGPNYFDRLAKHLPLPCSLELFSATPHVLSSQGVRGHPRGIPEARVSAHCCWLAR